MEGKGQDFMNVLISDSVNSAREGVKYLLQRGKERKLT